MTDAPSVTTFVMEERLPWPDDGPAAELNGPFDAGVIHDAGLRQICSIRKISALGATLRGQVTGAPGDEVALELATGHRHQGIIDWVRGGEAGIKFKQPIDVLALINRNLISQPAERRAMPRVELRCGLHVKWGASLSPAIMRNISARGLQIEGDALPPRGTFVQVFVDGLIVPSGEVVWTKGDLAGIELFEELSWSSIIPWIREVGRKGGSLTTAPSMDVQGADQAVGRQAEAVGKVRRAAGEIAGDPGDHHRLVAGIAGLKRLNADAVAGDRIFLPAVDRVATDIGAALIMHLRIRGEAGGHCVGVEGVLRGEIGGEGIGKFE